MNKRIKQLSFLLIILILILSAYKFGYQKALAETTAGKFFSVQNFLMFLRAWEIINRNFIDPQKIDNDKAMFEATRGLIKSLDDPYSDLLSEEQRKIFEEDLTGSFGGIGIEIGIRKGVLTVIAPLEETPAQRAGLKAGDKILKINAEETENMSLEEAVSKIRGKPGTKVTLTIFRDEWLEPKDFEITREVINIAVIKTKFISPNIGYIKINSFGATVYSEFMKAYNQLKSQGADRFIIDLRNNPGGYLEMAIKMSELFLPRGKIILKEVKRNGGTKSIISEGPGVIQEKVVILINKGSASASEIFAGALRDNLGIKLIGEKSFGKGSVQQTFPLNGNLLKLTIAYWLTPSGTKIEGNGLKPDIEVEEPKEETEKDPVLDKAIEVLK
ncbi:MAG: peptidase S41 [Candidatus Parcubacteria bacterium]|nr:MAG: peptidase S41 [Candidatus Parcubacteria bacterium]